jgi:hypothetical protein
VSGRTALGLVDRVRDVKESRMLRRLAVVLALLVAVCLPAGASAASMAETITIDTSATPAWTASGAINAVDDGFALLTQINPLPTMPSQYFTVQYKIFNDTASFTFTGLGHAISLGDNNYTLLGQWSVVDFSTTTNGKTTHYRHGGGRLMVTLIDGQLTVSATGTISP